MADYTFGDFREFRTLRPYENVDGVQELMDGLTLVYGETEIISGATRTIEAGDYIHRIPELRWLPLSEEDEATPEQKIWDSFHRRLKNSVEKTGVATDDVMVIITASTSYLKIAETIWIGTLQEFRSASKDGDQPHLALVGDPRPRPFQTPKGGCVVEVSVMLAKQLPKESQSRKPWRKGTWLGRARFTVSTDTGEIGFTPKPMDNATRDQLGVPRGTLRYTEMPDTLDPSEGAVEIEYYVDIDLLDEAQNNPRSDGARAFLNQMAIDVVRALVVKANREIFENGVSSPSEIQGSLCARLITAAARTERGDRNHDREAIFFSYIKNNPDLYLAHEEARLTKLKSILQKSMRSD